MIIIPSYGRPESVLTLSSFEPALLRETTLVVHPSEADRYRRNYSVRVVSTTEQGKGAAVVRQYILDKVAKGACLITDDDLAFQYGYWEDGRKRFKKLEGAMLTASIKKALDSVRNNRVALRFGTTFFNNFPDQLEAGGRGIAGFFLDASLVRRNRAARFDGIPTMEDIKLYLELLTSGWRVYSLSNVCACDKGKRGEGGESAGTNRGEAHRLAATYLACKYPRYIRIRYASNNSAHMDNIRCPVDITFYSKKAYKELIK